MRRRISYEAEYRRAIKAMNEAAVEKEEEKEKKEQEQEESFREHRANLIETTKSMADKNPRYHSSILNQLLEAALNGIYIGALSEIDILDAKAVSFCEARTKQFIEERGGAANLLAEMAGKNYLLDRIRCIVEDAAKEAEEESDEEDKAAEKVPDKAKEDMYDELDKEEEVDSAITIIADRITTAEEEFIKKNAEDKKKIEDIVNDINDRIESVKNNENMSEEEQEGAEDQLEQESARRIADVYNGRSQKPLFEFMVRKNTDIIVKDPQLKEAFTSVDGKLDMNHIVDTTSYMYGFLEFVNTLGLAKVGEDFISEMVVEM